MSHPTFRGVASPNIALIKYWGNRDHDLRLPSNPSLSMTLAGLETITELKLLNPGVQDNFVLNGETMTGPALKRVSDFMDNVRSMASRTEGVHIKSSNNFPAGAGLASSAAAFAALATVSSAAFSLDLSPVELSLLARRGSGSAARSIFAGFVEMHTGLHDSDGYAQTFLPPDYWELHDWIVVTDQSHKSTGSTAGHSLAETSPIQAARIADTNRRMQVCRQALSERDFAALAAVVEQDSNLMHAVMTTSAPPLLYLQPASLKIMHSVQAWRKEGIHACYTIDAGPNVHVLCTPESVDEVEQRLGELGLAQQLIHSRPGHGAKLLNPPRGRPR